MHRLGRPGLALAAVLLLAGCSAGATAQEPDWKPKQSFQGEGPLPSIPPPSPPGSTSSAPPSPSLTPRPGSTAGPDPAIVATRLVAPVGLTIMPDNTALVGERTTGRIVQVQPRPGQPVRTVRTIAGIDPAGDGGLLDLALSPNYQQDNLIFAYLTTVTDNRVVDFTLHGPVTPVLTGIPRGVTDNAGRIAFGTDGSLYVGTGDAGRPALAADPRSLAGKVLRVSDIGRPVPGNPSASSPVFTRGHHVVDGLCLDPKSGAVLEVEPAGAGAEVNLLRGGDSYASPSTGTGPRAGVQPPVKTLPAADGAPGGCAVQGGVLYVTSLDGAALLAASLSVQGSTTAVGDFTASLQKKYGRLRTVVAADDGALWLTTSNRDGHGKPVAADERVLRIVPAGAAATYPG